MVCMMDDTHTRIFLTGLPGSGKSTLAGLLAARLGWDAVDLDQEIERETRQSVPALFAQGEAVFRAAESKALAKVVYRQHIVVATGGGAVLAPANRAIIHASGIMLTLGVAPAIAAERLAAVVATAERPLLRDDPAARLRALEETRAPLYAEADLSIATDGLSPEQVALRALAALAASGLLAAADVSPNVIAVPLTAAPHTITCGAGTLAQLPTMIAALHLATRITIITDSSIADLYLPQVVTALEVAGVVVTPIIVPAGEASKSLTQLSTIYDALIDARHERGEAIIALGGGVVGDLAGFVAATYQRGVPLIQIPTTLLAMVDSAIGGKTGINHPRAKNSIGAFYQPRAVIADPSVLLTLPERIYREGWGEIVKYGVALDADLFDQIERERDALLHPYAATVPAIIARCAAIKAGIVADDEHEAGNRIILNYGHTIGHALETLTGYGTLLHGEAVFLGMAVEARIAQKLGIIDPTAVTRQDALSHHFYTPNALTIAALRELTPSAILTATRHDKKSQAGRVRWVLPTSIGSTAVRADVPDDLILDVIHAWHDSL